MDQSNEPLNIKLVVVGDGSVGKTCILLSYTTDKFPTEYVPTVFDNYTTQTVVDNKMINLSLWDTAGQETYNRLRTLSYSQADIFLIVFSVLESASFDNVQSKWYPELCNDELAKIPKIIVGNKIDARNPENSNHIAYESADKIIKSLNNNNIKYMECSALTQKGLKGLFAEAIRTAIQNKLNSSSQILAQSKIKEKDQPAPQENGCYCNIY